MNEEIALGKQVASMISENQTLRVQIGSQNNTIELMKSQYDALAASVDGARDRYEREVHHLRTERDQAVRKHSDIRTLLLQVSDLVMQALRANQGDEVPEDIPSTKVPPMNDERLPRARLG